MPERVSEQDGEATVAFEHKGQAGEIPAKPVEARKTFDAAVAEFTKLSRAADPESLARYRQAWDRHLVAVGILGDAKWVMSFGSERHKAEAALWASARS
jgi:hypothetical protein